MTEEISNNGFDKVNKPNHYCGNMVLNQLTLFAILAGGPKEVRGFYWGNVIKYLCRYQKKNGLEDLNKAKKYLDWLIADLKREDLEKTAIVK